ncbi:D-lactaldehyde dehydrogenase [Macrolepiota fuliginosa MF-IS2]|uniref:D-lactaldehyde dehydrogenase n=1 Tax=Macrolepiota fuliginosa MF-IS2 TaxID=1400762 RepID=A0A9P6BYE9_9AGAR|nr:D-lactaldehyde dehydrogenase [Macrolepiota fuliginosa MF-IS2]
MTIIPASTKILVTGANGYIAIWLVRLLLEQGYSVRGTVRSANKAKYLVEYFGSRGFGPDKLDVVVVDDITREGAFDEVVKDVDAIEHTASPFTTDIDDPQGYIEPAVQGTLGILKSTLKYGTNVKRIVITGSCAAVMSPPSKPTVFSEKDWNTASLEDVEKNGRNALTMSKYRTSKTLAEKAAWGFHEKHRTEVQWDLVVINPPFVFGPAIQDITGGPAGLNTSLKSWYDAVVADGPKSQELSYTSNAWVDVRDAALAHVLALQKEAAGGERIVVSAGSFVWQEWLDVAKTIQPYPLPNHPPAKGVPGLEKSYSIQYNTAKEKRIFGIKFKTMEETTRDTLENFAERGW